MRDIKLGLALGSGAARGWAHIGVIRELEALGLEPDIVAGASVGALVAAAYAAGRLDALEAWLRALGRREVFRLVDASFAGGGVMQGDRLMEAIGEQIGNPDIASLPKAFAAVATDLDSGREIWLRSGELLDAVRASSGLPGLFAPVQQDGLWLIDGGVVNPVPVNLCRAMGADYVIGVNLNAHIGHHGWRRLRDAATDEAEEDQRSWVSRERWMELVEGLVNSVRSSGDEPGVFDVVATSVNIMQDRITRSRMVGDPPNALLSPDLGHFRLMDFHRAGEAIAIGRQVAQRARDNLSDLKARISRAKG